MCSVKMKDGQSSRSDYVIREAKERARPGMSGNKSNVFVKRSYVYYFATVSLRDIFQATRKFLISEQW